MAILKQLATLAYFPNFSADRNVHLAEGLAQAKTDHPIAWGKPVDAVKRSLDDAAIGSSQFKLIARSQAYSVGCRNLDRW